MARPSIQRKIIGWRIDVMTRIPGLGLVKDYSIEYGNSPVRDRKSRLDKIQELMRAGRDYAITPIFDRELPDEDAEAA